MKLYKFLWQLSLGAIAFFAINLHPTITNAYDTPPVIFYEIAWAGSSLSTSDEWLVLKNTTDSVINLNGWKITKKSGGADVDMVELSGIIGVDGYFLISRKNQEESVLNIEPDITSAGISLVNSGLQLKLFNADGILIDIADDGVGTPMAGSNGTPKSSMHRIEPIGQGDVALSWASQTIQANLDSGVSELMSPRNSGAPKISISNWPNMLATGNFSSVNIDIASDETGDFNIYNNGELISSSSDKNSVINIGCVGDGNQNNLIKVVSPSGLYAELEGEIFCYRFADLVISEVMPAPQSGQKEWIEIYNPLSTAVNLRNWWLSDTSKSISIDDDTVVPAKGYLVLYSDRFSGISLNNNGDTVTLTSPEGDETGTVSWDDSQSALSYALFNGKYKWTGKPTPGKANIYLPVSSANDEVARPLNIPEVKTGDAKNYLNKWITVEGEVVENNGNTFYIDDGSGRLKIYIQESTNVDKPSMRKGDIFRITGIMNVYRDGDESRLLPRIIGDIELIQSNAENEGSDASDEALKTVSVLSGSMRLAKAGKAVITTKKMINSPQLLATIVKPFTLPKLPAKISFSEVSPSAPVLPTGEMVAELAIGGVGLLAIAKMLKTVVELWL